MCRLFFAVICIVIFPSPVNTYFSYSLWDLLAILWRILPGYVEARNGWFQKAAQIEAKYAPWAPVGGRVVWSLENHGHLVYIYTYIDIQYYTSFTAQGDGGSFKNRTPVGEVSCCDSWMAEPTDGLIGVWGLWVFLSLSLSIYLFIYLSIWPSAYLSIYLSVCLSISFYLSIDLSIHLSIYLPIYLSVCRSVYLSTYLSCFLSIYSAIYLLIYLFIITCTCASLQPQRAQTLPYYMYTYIHTYNNTNICTYVRTYIHTYIPTCSFKGGSIVTPIMHDDKLWPSKLAM